MRLAVSAVLCTVLCVPSVAIAAGPSVKVISPSGRVLAEGSDIRFDYPSDSSLVHVGSAISVGGNSTLNEITLLGGLVNVSQLDLFDNGGVALGSLAAAGHVTRPQRRRSFR